MEAIHNYQVAEIEVIYRPKFKASERPKISTGKEAANIFLDTWNPDTLELYEEFKVMILSRNNKVLGIFTASKGGIFSTTVDITFILGVALKAKASNLILCHNHPSGNLKPSETDSATTAKFLAASKILGLGCLDHIILTADGYFSFADNGLM